MLRSRRSHPPHRPDVGDGGGGGAVDRGMRKRPSSGRSPQRPRCSLSSILLLLTAASFVATVVDRSVRVDRRASIPRGGSDPSEGAAEAGAPPQGGVVAARRARSSSVRDDVGLTSPTTNATLHVVFSTDCESLWFRNPRLGFPILSFYREGGICFAGKNSLVHQYLDLFHGPMLHCASQSRPTADSEVAFVSSSAYQRWQSYLFFHSALKVGQMGYVTRIASGCDEGGSKIESQWHTQHVRSVLSDRFRIHFTPRFSAVKDDATGETKDYKFFNKPFGLKHFLEHGELVRFDASGADVRRPDDVVILTDPDFVLLRPLTDDFSNERETLVGPRRKKVFADQPSHVARPGRPYAQAYGLGAGWRKFDLDYVAGPSSPAKDVDQKAAGIYYPAGPPYVATAGDMMRLATTWSDFAPRVYEGYPHLLAEMYAYCIAAAHLRLPHALVDSMMVTTAGIGGEAWKFVKAIPAEEACDFAMEPDHRVRPVPNAVHYCQRYALDVYFWGKRKMPKEIFACDHPPLLEPPSDLGSGRYLATIAKKGGKEFAPEGAKMEAFMVCALTRATNDAQARFKANAGCPSAAGEDARKRYDLRTGRVVDVPAGTTA
ncbi:hypothetical protein ACHAWF_011350 [Thalassiosira exigua]